MSASKNSHHGRRMVKKRGPEARDSRRFKRKTNGRNSSAQGRGVKQSRNPEFGLVSILDNDEIFPSPENDQLYLPIDPNDPEIKALAESIRTHGLREPIILSRDKFILSGHRRFVACKQAGLRRIPCRRVDVAHDDTEFVPLLREHNRQRVKSLDEQMREEVVSANPEEAHRVLTAHRNKRARIDLDTIFIEDERVRARISDAKEPFLRAVKLILEDLYDFLPITVRQIHYPLLNCPPLRHASKPHSTYRNDRASYQDLSNLITRARIAGLIPFEAIHDPTRPVTIIRSYGSPAPFIREELDQFLKGYYRNSQLSQPNHIEIVGEKNTIQNIISSVAMEFCIPLTIGRGFSSLPVLYQMEQRFKKSGKEKLIILAVSDFDPDGEAIAHSFARSMRDDFGIGKIEPIKVALTSDQVRDLVLPAGGKAKPGSPNYNKFVEEFGNDVYELEALPPRTLQDLLRRTIEQVMDVDAFNAEIDKEKEEAAFLDSARARAHRALAPIIGNGGPA